MKVTTNFYCSVFSLLKESILHSLKNQKKIALIVSFALGCLAIGYLIKKYYFQANKDGANRSTDIKIKYSIEPTLNNHVKVIETKKESNEPEGNHIKEKACAEENIKKQEDDTPKPIEIEISKKEEEEATRTRKADKNNTENSLLEESKINLDEKIGENVLKEESEQKNISSTTHFDPDETIIEEESQEDFFQSPPAPWETLPKDLIFEIFQYLEHPQDFQSLALVNKHFNEISQIPKACNLTEFVPTFIAHTTDPSTQKLSTWNKILLAHKILENLKSNHPIKVIQSSTFNQKSYTAYPKVLVGDYFVLIPNDRDIDPVGMIQIDHLKSKQSITFKGHNKRIDSCLAIQTPKPFIVTINEEEGFKIWDLEKLDLQNGDHQQALVLHNTSTILMKSDLYASQVEVMGGTSGINNHTVINTYQNFLGVAYNDKVLILDCTYLHSSANSLEIQFNSAKQIYFTDQHILLASDSSLTIWDMSTVKKAIHNQQKLTVASSIYSYSLTSQNIRFAEMHKNMVIIAYTKGYQDNNNNRFVIGEILDYTTGNQLRLMSHQCKQFTSRTLNFMNAQGNDLFTGSNFVSQWDMEAKNDEEFVFDKIVDKYNIIKIYATGQNILVGHPKWLMVAKRDDLSTKPIRDNQMDKVFF